MTGSYDGFMKIMALILFGSGILVYSNSTGDTQLPQPVLSAASRGLSPWSRNPVRWLNCATGRCSPQFHTSAATTFAPGRSQVNIIRSRKREHSRKPDEQYTIIEECSWGPRLEMFSRGKRRDL